MRHSRSRAVMAGSVRHPAAAKHSTQETAHFHPSMATSRGILRQQLPAPADDLHNCHETTGGRVTRDESMATCVVVHTPAHASVGMAPKRPTPEFYFGSSMCWMT